jgi:hypothetical protein
MKKQTIIFLLLFLYHSSFSQIKTISVDCTDSYLLSLKGKYEKAKTVIGAGTISGLAAGQQQTMLKRLDTVHQMLLKAYPVPTGFEAYWWKVILTANLATNLNGENGIPVYTSQYRANFNSYGCYQNKPRDLFCCEPGTSTFQVYVNDFGAYGSSAGGQQNMMINGLRVYMRYPVKGKWKGFELVHIGNLESTKRVVLLHRPGELPYIPVTRKQYLEFCLKYLDEFMDKQVKGMNDMPEGTPEQKKIKDETIQRIVNNKKKILKRYEDEMEKTKAAYLLDSPAIILEVASIHDGVPIFTTEDENGKMLYTHNPGYIKKNLPKSVAQFITVSWTWSDYLPVGGAAGMYYRKMLEENFPIEKLHALIR